MICRLISLLMPALALFAWAVPSRAYIGGTPVPPNGLPSVVTFDLISCTAVKVGPRQFLMAAHYIQPARDLTVAHAGDPLRILSHTLTGPAARTVGRAQLRSDSTRIRAVVIHPTYQKGIASAPEASEILTRPGLIDLALLEVDNDTPAIAAEPLRTTPLVANEPILMGGYGALNAASRPRFQLRAAWKRVAPGSPGAPGNATLHYATDLDADGKSHSMGWEGDSGGPVHAVGPGNRLVVAGINSYVMGVIWLRADGTLEDPRDAGTTHFVRLDHPSARAWLRQLGLISN